MNRRYRHANDWLTQVGRTLAALALAATALASMTLAATALVSMALVSTALAGTPLWPAPSGRLAAQDADRSGGDSSERRQDENIARLIEVLEHYEFTARSDAWVSAVVELTEIGEPAVLPLIEALESTDEDRPLRALAFTLRAIGDPRAVPALVRAIPRTLRRPGSDMGLQVDHPDLLAFMQKHDLDSHDRDAMFGMARPVREVCGALISITGTDQGDGELYSVFLTGSRDQQVIQRRLYHELAVRWQRWWAENWRSNLMDPGYSDIGLEPFHDMPLAPDLEAPNPFPFGETAETSGSSMGWVLEPVQDSLDLSLIDLDTSRNAVRPPAELWASDDEMVRAILGQDDSFAGWAESEGFDLVAVRIELPGLDGERFALVSTGMRLWRIDNARWHQLPNEVTRDRPLELGEPVHGILWGRDPETGDYLPMEPATYLFQTRDGATGAIQVVSQVTRILTAEDLPLGRPLEPDEGFRRGVRFNFQFIHEIERP